MYWVRNVGELWLRIVCGVAIEEDAQLFGFLGRGFFFVLSLWPQKLFSKFSTLATTALEKSIFVGEGNGDTEPRWRTVYFTRNFLFVFLLSVL